MGEEIGTYLRLRRILGVLHHMMSTYIRMQISVRSAGVQAQDLGSRNWELAFGDGKR
jgi:hypothetical protein